MSGITWLNKYIGLPYHWCGRDELGTDCYGLVMMIYKERYQIDLPDWTADRMDLKARCDRIEEVVCSGEFIRSEEPQEGDIVVCYNKKAAYHVGMYFGGGVIHAADGIGSMYVPLSRFEKEHRRLEFGKWNP